MDIEFLYIPLHDSGRCRKNHHLHIILSKIKRKHHLERRCKKHIAQYGFSVSKFCFQSYLRCLSKFILCCHSLTSFQKYIFFDPFDHGICAVQSTDIGKEKWSVTAHFSGIPVHNRKISPDIRCKINLIDDKKI